MMADALESRLFRSYWDDGLLDLTAGVGVMATAGFWAADLIALGAAVPAILAVLWTPLRRVLIEPRSGLVEFSEARDDRLRRLNVRTAALGVSMLLAFAGIDVFVGRPEPLLSSLAPAVPALLLGLMAVVTGWGLGLPRFLGYAAVLSFAGLAVAVAEAGPEMAMFAGGAALLAGGAWRLGRFLRLPIEHGEDA